VPSNWQVLEKGPMKTISADVTCDVGLLDGADNSVLSFLRLQGSGVAPVTDKLNLLKTY
jgi:hypothetical protein